MARACTCKFIWITIPIESMKDQQPTCSRFSHDGKYIEVPNKEIDEVQLLTVDEYRYTS